MLGQVLVKHFDDVVAPSQDEFDLLKQAPEFSPCDVIIHCAAMTVVDDCEKDQALCRRINVDGTARVVDLARRWNAQLFFISTPMVFSGRRGNYREHDRTSPINYYGWTKREGERLIARYNRGIIIRANPIGVRPTGSFPSFIQWFVSAAKENRSFDLFTDVHINPVSTVTLAEIILQLNTADAKDRILHIGSRDVANKADIWEYVRKHFPDYHGTVRRVSVDQTAAGKTATRPKEMWLNIDRIQKKYRIHMPSWRHEVDQVLNVL